MAKQPYGECGRCGFKYRLNQLAKEWSGLRVCKGAGTNDCFDPKPPELSAPPVKAEGVPLPNAAPETTPIYAKYTDGSHL